MTARVSFWRRLDDNAERWLLLVFYAMIVATIVVEVVRRFVLAYSSLWGEEIARYAFIYLAWVGASAAVKERAHIRIDVLLHYLSSRARAAVYLLGDLCMLALAVLASRAALILEWTRSSLWHSGAVKIAVCAIVYALLLLIVERRQLKKMFTAITIAIKNKTS